MTDEPPEPRPSTNLAPWQPYPQTLALPEIDSLVPHAIRRFIEPLTDPHGRLHWLWTGPVRADQDLPILWHFAGRRNVPVHRVLFALVRRDSPIRGRGLLNRLEQCAYRHCVHPACFVLASTPMEVQPWPDVMVDQPDLERQRRTGNPDARRSRALATTVDGHGLYGLQDRHIYHPSSDDRSAPCPHCGGWTQWVECPEGHRIYAEWAQDPERRLLMSGKQYRCRKCTEITNSVKLATRGKRPRAGFRPITRQTASKRDEMELMESKLREMDRGEWIGPGAHLYAPMPSYAAWIEEEDPPEEEYTMTYRQAMLRRQYPGATELPEYQPDEHEPDK